MTNLRAKAVASSISNYVRKNKKVIICALLLFILGIAVGVIWALKAVDGNFDKVSAADAEKSSARVFFLFLLTIICCYIAILISGINNKTVFVIIFPFLLIGIILGKYACALVGRYEGLGVLNLLVIYLPFLIITFLLMTIASINMIMPACYGGSEYHTLKPSFVKLLKLFGINVAWAIVEFLIIGSLMGVIIVKLY